MPTRDQVYQVISGERAFQDQHRRHGGAGTVGEEITLLHYYLTQATAEWTENIGDLQALHVIRKIAGIAVRCLENHEAPPREPETSLADDLTTIRDSL